MKNKYLILLIGCALVLRIIVASFLYHTDTKAIYRDAMQTGTGLREAYRTNIASGSPLPYPPLTYIFFNTYQSKLHFLFSSYFSTWMYDWSTLQTENHPKIFRDLFAMKFPLLLADFFVAFILYKLAHPDRKNIVLFLWLLNPVTIFSIYATGQFDILPTLIILLGLYFWEHKKSSLTYIFFGLSAGLKLYALLLLPLLLLLDTKKTTHKLFNLAASLLAFLLTLAPTHYSPDILKSIFTSNLADSTFKATLNLGNNALLPLALLAYSGFLLYLWLARTKPSLLQSIFIVLSLILALSRFHPQWIVWISPLLVLLLADNKIDLKLGFWFVVSYFGSIFLLQDKFTNFGLFKAINNSFDTLDSLRFYLDRLGIGTQAYGFFIAAFLAGVIVMTATLLQGYKPSLNLQKFNLLKYSLPATGLYLFLFVTVFSLSHLPLTYLGQYLDTEYSSQNVVAPLTPTTKLTQTIPVKHNNLNSLQFMIKNINLRTKTNLNWRLFSETSQTVAQGTVSGTQIGDDFDLTLHFPEIADSAGKTYYLELSSDPVDKGEEFVIPYDDRRVGGLSLDGKLVGSLAYRTFSNPGSWSDNISYSLKNIVSRL